VRVGETSFASIIVACRNERQHIAACIDSLLSSDYPADRFEVLIVDGMSDDGTRDVVAAYGARDPRVRLVDNPRRITPAAFNAGIRAARGDVVAIVGAHASYDRRYLAELVRHLHEYGADEVGAVAQYVPRADTVIGRALVMVQRHRFGAGANVGYKVGASAPKWVDTVSSGCYRKDVFERVGLFNERLVFSQDIEFNSRLRRAGGRILLVPTARIVYHARSDLGSFLRHQIRNGVWIIVPLAYTDHVPFSWRHFVPMAFTGTLVGAALLSPVLAPARWLLGLVAGAYLVAALAASADAAIRERRPEYLLSLPPAFLLLHGTYGLGSWWGLVELARRRAADRAHPPAAATP
jgi:succinoglycan biosynthesis protein ExoA